MNTKNVSDVSFELGRIQGLVYGTEIEDAVLECVEAIFSVLKGEMKEELYMRLREEQADAEGSGQTNRRSGNANRAL